MESKEQMLRSDFIHVFTQASKEGQFYQDAMLDYIKSERFTDLYIGMIEEKVSPIKEEIKQLEEDTQKIKRINEEIKGIWG